MTPSSLIRRFSATALAAVVSAYVTDVALAMPALFSTQTIKTVTPNENIKVGFYFDGYVPAPFVGDVVIDPWTPALSPYYYVPYEPLPYVYLAPVVFCPPLIYYGSGRMAERAYGPYPPLRYSSIYAGFGRTWASFPHRPFRGYKGYYR